MGQRRFLLAPAMPRTYLACLCLLLGTALLALALRPNVDTPPLSTANRNTTSGRTIDIVGLAPAISAPAATPTIPIAPAPSPPDGHNAPADPRSNWTTLQKNIARRRGLLAPEAEPRLPALVGRCMRNGRGVGMVDLELTATANPGSPLLLVTDPAGRFRAQVPPPGDYVLAVHGREVSEHQAPFTLHVDVDQTTDLRLGDLLLRDLVTLTGRIVDASGRPISGAAVTCTDASDAGMPKASATTDAAGRYAFPDVAAGQHTIRARRDRAAAVHCIDVAAAGTATAADLALRPLQTVRGGVCDDTGAPLGASLHIVDHPGFDSPVPTVVQTGRDGRYELEVPRGADLLVESSGCLPRTLAAGELGDTNDLVLYRAMSLVGRVDRVAAGAFVLLQPGPRSQARQLDAARDRLGIPVPVDADGAFRIDRLPPGQYSVVAVQPDTGRSHPIDVDLPQPAPASLSIALGAARTIRVLDDRGDALPFAVVRVCPAPDAVVAVQAELADRVLAAPSRSTWRTDHDGLCVLAADAKVDLAIAIDCAGHLPAAGLVRVGEELVELRVPRAAILAGRIAERPDAVAEDLRVLAWPRGDDRSHALRLPLAADGTFRSGDLPAGAWQVALERLDRSRSDRTGSSIPLLAGGVDHRTTVLVDAGRGLTADIVVPVPPITRIDGCVWLGNHPAPGVVVFAVPLGDDGKTALNPLGWDAIHAHALLPHTTTDCNGHFVLHAARPGTYEVRARHPAQPVAGPAQRLVVDAYGGVLAIDLRLPTGAVRGHCPNSAAAPLPRLAHALLCPAADAAAAQPGDERCRLQVMLTATGGFAFAAVPAGSYVLRICGAERVLQEVPVQVGSTAVDLDLVALPTAIANAAPARPHGIAPPAGH